MRQIRPSTIPKLRDCFPERAKNGLETVLQTKVRFRMRGKRRLPRDGLQLVRWCACLTAFKTARLTPPPRVSYRAVSFARRARPTPTCAGAQRADKAPEPVHVPRQEWSGFFYARRQVSQQARRSSFLDARIERERARGDAVETAHGRGGPGSFGLGHAGPPSTPCSPPPRHPTDSALHLVSRRPVRAAVRRAADQGPLPRQASDDARDAETSTGGTRVCRQGPD